MKRTLLFSASLLALAACQVAPDQRAALPPPLPDKVTPQPYGQLLQRARAQASRATEAFYVDNWAELEDACRGLEQTAQYLAKAEDVPTKHRDTLTAYSGDLGKQAKSLRDAATAKDVKKTTDLLSRIHAKVREMRLSD
jgi:hypothetical protein